MPRSIQITGSASGLRTFNTRDVFEDDSLIMLWNTQDNKYLLFIGVGLACMQQGLSKYYLLSKMRVDNVEVVAWLRANLDCAADFHDEFEDRWQARSGAFDIVVPDFFPDPMVIRYRMNSQDYLTADEDTEDANSIASTRSSVSIKSTV